ncbi:MAG: DUF4118 domain-containing protein [Hyphomicrobiales bacterium]|nr:DUF4118 domain-containing protein [Hyphomicrobiales bacterium]
MTTAIAYGLYRYLGVRRGSVIYLLPVMLAGWHLGLIPALVAAATGVLWSGYFFYSPFYGYFLARPTEILNLTLFMAVGVITSHLANLAKQQAELARKRENEMSDLYAFSRRLAAAPSAAEIYLAIEEYVANLVQRNVVLYQAGSTNHPRGVAAPDAMRDAIEEIQRGSIPATTIESADGSTWFLRRVSPRTPDFGVIAIELGRAPKEMMAEIRQRLDGALSDAAATLERLDVARSLSEAKMRSETELLREALIGSVSHELRTPLASILGAATVLTQSPAVARDERLKSLAAVVHDEAERLNSDIQNLLDATRITRGQVRPRMEWIEPQDIVNSALERRHRGLAGHPIEVAMDPNLPLIFVDPVLVEQAFVQVVDNAAKYSPAGAPIAVSAKRTGGEVLFTVQDHGAGLTAEELAHVGERFFRSARHSSIASGSGLGLWIAKAFVAANGGHLRADSRGVDQGTRVSIHLPLATKPPPTETLNDD